MIVADVVTNTIGAILVLPALFFILSCQTVSKSPATAVDVRPSFSSEPWELSKDASIRAETIADKKDKARIAREGISFAEECLMKNPEDAACYYYRAINTGIYYSAHVVGYQEGLKTMIRDCKKVIELNDKVDHGGAYRTLGKIYMEVPETALSKNGVRRDIELAISYLEKAVMADPDYPENHIYMAEALIESGNKKEAVSALSKAETLVPHWKNHVDYTAWLKLNKELAGKLKREKI